MVETKTWSPRRKEKVRKTKETLQGEGVGKSKESGEEGLSEACEVG